MAMDPFIQQLWANANRGPTDEDPQNWGAIQAWQILAERFGVAGDIGDPGVQQQIRSGVLASDPDLVAAHGGSVPVDTPTPTGVAPPPAVTPTAPIAANETNAGPMMAPGAAATGVTAAQRRVFDDLSAYLNEAGLGELWTVGPDGTPAGWLWDQIVSGLDSAAVLRIRMEDTEPFNRKYGVIKQMRERAAKGEAVLVPSIREVLDYRVQARSTLQNAGLPAWFYDEDSDADALMLNGLSVPEIEDRLGRAWTQVQSSDPSIRTAFSRFYGVAEGDAALAAFFLDKDKTMAKLETASRAAFTAGRGSTLGLDISREVAERVAGSELSEGAIVERLAAATDLAPLTVESIGERGEDITQGDAVAGTLLDDSMARRRFERRRAERDSLRSATGGAVVGASGVLGLG